MQILPNKSMHFSPALQIVKPKQEATTADFYHIMFTVHAMTLKVKW